MTFRTMKIAEHKNSVMYRTACQCGEPDHDMVLDMEIDEDFVQLELHFYVTLGRWTWGEGCWVKRQWKKLKYATRILFTGHLELECDFLMQGEDQVNGLIEALREGRDKMSKLTE